MTSELVAYIQGVLSGLSAAAIFFAAHVSHKGNRK